MVVTRKVDLFALRNIDLLHTDVKIRKGLGVVASIPFGKSGAGLTQFQ